MRFDAPERRRDPVAGSVARCPHFCRRFTAMSSPPLPPSGRFDLPVAHASSRRSSRRAPRRWLPSSSVTPHPVHGGTMNNNVVYRVAKALTDAGRRRAALQLPRRRPIQRHVRRRRRRGGRRARRARVSRATPSRRAALDGGLLVRRARRADRGRRRRARREAARRGPGAAHVRLQLPGRLDQAQGRSSRPPTTSSAAPTRSAPPSPPWPSPSASTSSRAPPTSFPATSTRSSRPRPTRSLTSATRRGPEKRIAPISDGPTTAGAIIVCRA